MVCGELRFTTRVYLDGRVCVSLSLCVCACVVAPVLLPPDNLDGRGYVSLFMCVYACVCLSGGHVGRL